MPKIEKGSFFQEIVRKLVHINSFFIVLMYYIFGQKLTLMVLTFALVFALELEYFRIEWGKKIPFFHNLYRQKEEKTLGGHVFLGISSIIAIAVYSREIALIAILMTTVGDACAAVFGRAYGKRYIKGLREKAIEGVFAEFVGDLVVGVLFVILFVGEVTLGWGIIIFVMSIVATIVETVSGNMDDNLLVPLFSGIYGEVLLYVLTLIGIAL